MHSLNCNSPDYSVDIGDLLAKFASRFNVTGVALVELDLVPGITARLADKVGVKHSR